MVGAELRFLRLAEDWGAGKWRLDLDRLFSLCDERTLGQFSFLARQSDGMDGYARGTSGDPRLFPQTWYRHHRR